MFNSGRFIPKKMIFCNECNDEILRNKCKVIVNRNKDFKAIFNSIKRQLLNEFGHMLPIWSFFQRGR